MINHDESGLVRHLQFSIEMALFHMRGAHTEGAEDFNCGGDSTGIRLRSNNKLIRQSLSQIAKTDGTSSVVAAHLAMKEHQGEGERQNANHGEHDQRLAAALMHGWFFEVAVGSDMV